MGHLEAVNRPDAYYGSCQRLCFCLCVQKLLKWLIPHPLTLVVYISPLWLCPCLFFFNRRISWQQHLLTASVNLPLIQVNIFLCGCAINSRANSLLQPPGLLLGDTLDGIPCPIWVEKLINLLVLCLPSPCTGKNGTTCSSTVITWPGSGRQASTVDWGAAAFGAYAGR